LHSCIPISQIFEASKYLFEFWGNQVAMLVASFMWVALDVNVDPSVSVETVALSYAGGSSGSFSDIQDFSSVNLGNQSSPANRTIRLVLLVGDCRTGKLASGIF